MCCLSAISNVDVMGNIYYKEFYVSDSQREVSYKLVVFKACCDFLLFYSLSVAHMYMYIHTHIHGCWKETRWILQKFLQKSHRYLATEQWHLLFRVRGHHVVCRTIFLTIWPISFFYTVSFQDVVVVRFFIKFVLRSSVFLF